VFLVGYLLLFVAAWWSEAACLTGSSFPCSSVSAGRVQVLQSLSEPVSRAVVCLCRLPLRFSSLNFVSFSSVRASPGLRLGSRWIRPVPAPQTSFFSLKFRPTENLVSSTDFSFHARSSRSMSLVSASPFPPAIRRLHTLFAFSLPLREGAPQSARLGPALQIHAPSMV
jgi:hypothetical protein